MIQPQTSKKGIIFTSEICSRDSGPFSLKLNLKNTAGMFFFYQTSIYSFRFSFVAIFIDYAKIISNGFNPTDICASTKLLSKHLKSITQRLFWPRGLVV